MICQITIKLLLLINKIKILNEKAGSREHQCSSSSFKAKNQGTKIE